jgi:G patch domain-containing protein 1
MHTYVLLLAQRGATLGEAPLPTAPRSVFDYMSQKDRERLQRAAAGAGGPSSSTGSSSSTSMPPPIAQPATIDIPRIEPFIAKAALMGFQPFIKDPVKHERYTIYLKSQSTVDGSAPSLTPYPGQSIDAFNKEVSDFSKSATVFKPLSGAMAGRFTSAAVVESGATAQEGLYQPKFDPAEEAKSKEAEKEKKIEPEVDLDPSTNAARLGMYGPMTRTVTKWAPARLLCKRFGVKDPHPELDAEGVPAPPSASTSTSTAQEPIAAIMPTDSTTDGEVPAYPTTDDIKAPSGPRDLSNIGLGDDEYQAQDVLTYQRPSMDVFKAIFASDDEDSDDEDAPVNVKTAIAGPTVALEQDISSSTIPSAATAIPSIAAQPGPATLTTPSALGQILETTSLDLSTFRPTFVSRSDRSQAQKADDASKSRKKKRTNALVSFDDEDGEGSGLGVPKVKKRKEKHKNKEKDGDKKHKTKLDQVDVEDEWVEKPVAEVVKNMSLSSEAGGPATQIKGRKTAVDFM